jgi:hypothetical protein
MTPAIGAHEQAFSLSVVPNDFPGLRPQRFRVNVACREISRTP